MTNKKDNQVFINIKFTPEDIENEGKEELERLTHTLRDDLSELDSIEKVDLVNTGERVPEGAKSGGEMVAMGSLLVTIGTSIASNIIPNLTNTLQSWLTRYEKRKISLQIGGDKIEMAGISDKEQKRLIDTWIRYHLKKA